MWLINLIDIIDVSEKIVTNVRQKRAYNSRTERKSSFNGELVHDITNIQIASLRGSKTMIYRIFYLKFLEYIERVILLTTYINY